MRKAFALFLALPLTACVVGPEGGGGGGGSGGGSGGGGGGDGGGGGMAGRITTNTMWSGAVLVEGMTTIDPGVTLTVAAGTTVTFKDVGALVVEGTLDIQGTSAGVVTIKPEATRFGGITINGPGKATLKFVEATGGSILINGSALLTIVDSRMSKAPNADFILMNGGTLDMTYSHVGLEPGETDTTHCSLHFGGAGNVIKVNNSNISTSSYGLMFYGGTNADFKLNNWFSNTVDVDVSATSAVTGDFSRGWFEKGQPSGAGVTAMNLAPARLVDCDGTNDAMCAGPRP